MRLPHRVPNRRDPMVAPNTAWLSQAMTWKSSGDCASSLPFSLAKAGTRQRNRFKRRRETKITKEQAAHIWRVLLELRGMRNFEVVIKDRPRETIPNKEEKEEESA